MVPIDTANLRRSADVLSYKFQMEADFSWITVGIIAFLIITLVVCGSGLLMHYLS